MRAPFAGEIMGTTGPIDKEQYMERAGNALFLARGFIDDAEQETKELTWAPSAAIESIHNAQQALSRAITNIRLGSTYEERTGV
jgi:hypothetical protein